MIYLVLTTINVFIIATATGITISNVRRSRKLKALYPPGKVSFHGHRRDNRSDRSGAAGEPSALPPAVRAAIAAVPAAGEAAGDSTDPRDRDGPGLTTSVQTEESGWLGRLDPDAKAPDTTELVKGFRAWGLDRSGYLIAVTQGGRWMPRLVEPADCRTHGGWGDDPDHEVPDPNCGCGWYAVDSLDDIQQPGGSQPLVYGEIAQWGKVVRGRKGARSQFAYPLWLKIYFPERLQPDKKRRKTVAKNLAERYGVPVTLVTRETYQADCMMRVSMGGNLRMTTPSLMATTTGPITQHPKPSADAKPCRSCLTRSVGAWMTKDPRRDAYVCQTCGQVMADMSSPFTSMPGTASAGTYAPPNPNFVAYNTHAEYQAAVNKAAQEAIKQLDAQRKADEWQRSQNALKSLLDSGMVFPQEAAELLTDPPDNKPPTMPLVRNSDGTWSAPSGPYTLDSPPPGGWAEDNADDKPRKPRNPAAGGTVDATGEEKPQASG